MQSQMGAMDIGANGVGQQQGTGNPYQGVGAPCLILISAVWTWPNDLRDGVATFSCTYADVWVVR